MGNEMKGSDDWKSTVYVGEPPLIIVKSFLLSSLYLFEMQFRQSIAGNDTPVG